MRTDRWIHQTPFFQTNNLTNQLLNMPMISDRVFRAENSTATIESADPRSVQNKGYFLPNANVAYPSYREARCHASPFAGNY